MIEIEHSIEPFIEEFKEKKGRLPTMNEFKFHIEAEFLLSVLEDCEGNLSKAANQLGISRETLSRKIEYKKFQQSLKNKWNGKKP